MPQASEGLLGVARLLSRAWAGWGRWVAVGRTCRLSLLWAVNKDTELHSAPALLAADVGLRWASLGRGRVLIVAALYCTGVLMAGLVYEAPLELGWSYGVGWLRRTTQVLAQCRQQLLTKT